MTPASIGDVDERLGIPRHLGRHLSRLSEGRGASAFDPTLDTADLVALGGSIASKALRGALWKPRFAESRLLLVGRGVSIRNPRRIRESGALVIEDYAEVQGLSTEGLRFGHRVTIGRFASIRPSGYYGREIGAGLEVGDYSNGARTASSDAPRRSASDSTS